MDLRWRDTEVGVLEFAEGGGLGLVDLEGGAGVFFHFLCDGVGVRGVLLLLCLESAGVKAWWKLGSAECGKGGNARGGELVSLYLIQFVKQKVSIRVGRVVSKWAWDRNVTISEIKLFEWFQTEAV